MGAVAVPRDDRTERVKRQNQATIAGPFAGARSSKAPQRPVNGVPSLKVFEAVASQARLRVRRGGEGGGGGIRSDQVHQKKLKFFFKKFLT